MRCSHCAFLIEGQWALRSCGSPSAALQPMLCQRGLAPFYRPAIRAVQTAQELQIVRGAVLGFEEVVRAQGPRPKFCFKKEPYMWRCSCQMGWRMAELASNPTAAWRVGTGSRADNVPWSPGPGSCPRTCCTPCTLPWAMYMPDHMRRSSRPSERLLRRRPRQSRPSVIYGGER